MSDYFDRLPSSVREQVRKRMRNPWEYEQLREKVKGPEDLEREMEKNADFADIKLSLEIEPKAQEKAKDLVKEAGITSIIDPSERLKNALKTGKFEVTVDARGHEPKLAVKIKSAPSRRAKDGPMGNVQEVFPLKMALQQQIVSSLQQGLV